MKKLTLLFLALAVTGLLAAASLADISGAWEITTVTQRGEMKSDVTFVQDGEKLTVTLVSMRQGSPVESKGEGTIKGADVEWKITRQTQRGEFTTTYKGKIVDDNNMAGTMEMGGGMGMGGGGTPPEPPAWKAVRKPK